ncbi:MAG: hypothetical protein J7M25_06915 [Deltaproteobacteria bacterium]|nr:hypothetical protein [Deltaproteobacteria bacterium]
MRGASRFFLLIMVMNLGLGGFAQPVHAAPSRVVYGYLSVWRDNTDYVRWDKLTHVAWNCLKLQSDGALDTGHISYSRWPSHSPADEAHVHGVLLHLGFCLSGDDLRDFLLHDSRWPATIQMMIDQMEAGDADGISIDFESFRNADEREPFVQFFRNLRDALDARGHSDAEIQMAGPAMDWLGCVDFSALLDIIDYYFIMVYDIVWPFGSGTRYVGPSGLYRVTEAYHDAAPAHRACALASLADYLSQIPLSLRSKVIFGVPYYGRLGVVSEPASPAVQLRYVGEIKYYKAKEKLDEGVEHHWDPDVFNSYMVWQEGGEWYEAFYEDTDSLAVRYRLILDADLGGMGMWALNLDVDMDQGVVFPELWQLLDDYFVANIVQPAEELGHRNNPIRVDAFPFHDERDTAHMDGNGYPDASLFFFAYGGDCDPDRSEFGPEWVYRIDVCQSGTLTVHAEVPPDSTADPDVHLLSDMDPDTCLFQDDATISVSVEPDGYVVTVDTHVVDQIDRRGPYVLDISFEPDPGTTPCPDGTVCRDGICEPEDASDLAILSVEAVDITETSARIHFVFNQRAQGQVEYGMDTSYGFFSVKEESFQYAEHTQSIDSLSAGTRYHYRVHAWDRQGHEIIGQDHEFVTAGVLVCPDGLTGCDGTCVDTETDDENCGACGHRCGDGETCREGTCMVKNQQQDGGTTTEGGGAESGCGGCRQTKGTVPFGFSFLALLFALFVFRVRRHR